jgi:hypothetical protein
MEITVLSDYYNYIAERFKSKTYLPLTLILWGIISLYNKNLNITLIPVLFILLFFFRLIDDISDLKKDSIDFPNRVLVKTKHLSIFFISLAIIHLILNVFFYLTDFWTFKLFNIYTFILSATCILLRFKTKLEFLPTLASLTKYSFFILLFTKTAYIHAGVVFAFFLFYEWWHNRK